MILMSVSELAGKGFEGIEKRIIECTACTLHETVTNKVISKGSKTPKVVFVGEAPGKNEDETGIPFCGRAGKNLDRMIDYMGLSKNEYTVINTIKCRPPNNRNPLKKEINACRPFMLAQIQILDPRVIILLGNTAEKAFCSKDKLEWGIPKTIDNRYSLLKLYHPAALIYQRSRIDEQNEHIDRNRHLWDMNE